MVDCSRSGESEQALAIRRQKRPSDRRPGVGLREVPSTASMKKPSNTVSSNRTFQTETPYHLQSSTGRKPRTHSILVIVLFGLQRRKSLYPAISTT